MSTAHNGSVGA